MIAAPSEPGEVVRAVSAGVGRLVSGRLTDADRERQLDALADLYAEQTDVRHPLAPPGSGHARPLRTRDEIRAHFAFAGPRAGGPDRFEPVDTVVHTTGDPEVVVVEFAYAVSDRGRDFRIPCVFVVRVRDGRIVESRDYTDHGALTRT